MAEWRNTGDKCPDGKPEASLQNCLGYPDEPTCRYNRGASGLFGRGPRMLCNWPRDGSYNATPESLPERPTVPDIFYD